VKVCNQCVLPDTFPAIRFNDNGTCQHCLDHKGASQNQALRQKYLAKFQTLLGNLGTQGAYDALMAYSGGKDSSYTLKILTEVFHLRVLAVTFDHGFVSPRAVDNIHAVTRALDVDHVMFAPGQKRLHHAFRESISQDLYSLKALQRASSICTTCMNLVKSYLLKTAIEMRIPLLVYGWSPGQAPVQAAVMKLNGAMVGQAQTALVNSLREVMGDALKSFVLQERDLELLDGRKETAVANSFYNVHPLAFLDYDEERIVGEIESLGWRPPEDTDANSTNCLLNGFANQVHMEKYGFHPYAFEVANLVRDGFMTRDFGLKKLGAPADSKVTGYVKRKLGIE
jgi:tRNA(Ile)-lysidine synthase TilS/MesJ